MRNELLTMYYKQNSDVLPAEYRRVVWIRSDYLNTYIDTGVGPDASGRLEIELRASYESRKSFGSILGNYVNEATNAFRLILTSDTATGAKDGYVTCGQKAGVSLLLPEMPPAEWITYHMRNGSCTLTIGGESTTYSVSQNGGTANAGTIKIGCNGVASNNPSPGVHVAYYKCWKGGALVRDMIPVVRNADSKPGLWDKVSRFFFTNAGGGVEFTWREF